MKLYRRKLFSFALLLVAGPCLARSDSQGNSQTTITLLPSSITSGGSATISQIVFPGINSTEISIGSSIVGLETKNRSIASSAYGDVTITLKNTSSVAKIISASIVCYVYAEGQYGSDTVATSVVGSRFLGVTYNSSSNTFGWESGARTATITRSDFLDPGEEIVVNGASTINASVPVPAGTTGGAEGPG